LEESFTIKRLEAPVSLHRFPATTNVIDNPHAGVRISARGSRVESP
jgi:hypothetical protein